MFGSELFAVALLRAEADRIGYYAKLMREAKSPAEADSVVNVWRQEEQRRHELAVARASAPQVTVINRIL